MPVLRGRVGDVVSPYEAIAGSPAVVSMMQNAQAGQRPGLLERIFGAAGQAGSAALGGLQSLGGTALSAVTAPIRGVAAVGEASGMALQAYKQYQQYLSDQIAQEMQKPEGQRDQSRIDRLQGARFDRNALTQPTRTQSDPYGLAMFERNMRVYDEGMRDAREKQQQLDTEARADERAKAAPDRRIQERRAKILEAIQAGREISQGDRQFLYEYNRADAVKQLVDQSVRGAGGGGGNPFAPEPTAEPDSGGGFGSMLDSLGIGGFFKSGNAPAPKVPQAGDALGRARGRYVRR